VVRGGGARLLWALARLELSFSAPSYFLFSLSRRSSNSMSGMFQFSVHTFDQSLT